MADIEDVKKVRLSQRHLEILDLLREIKEAEYANWDTDLYYQVQRAMDDFVSPFEASKMEVWKRLLGTCRVLATCSVSLELEPEHLDRVRIYLLNYVEPYTDYEVVETNRGGYQMHRP